MRKPELSLFCHPTTTIYIDDNKDFLNALTMKSTPGSFKLFNDPHEGLVYIESQFKLSENFSKGEPLSPDINTPHKLVLPQNKICQKLNTLNRFAEPSVVVLDFSMPELNGLDLSSQLSNPHCKKVMLTGVANDRQAIQALNADLIDFYVGKNEDGLINRLNTIVKTLNARYFMDLMPISPIDALAQIPFIFDSNFADYFEQICEELEATEYYFVTNPGGFLIIDKYGNISRLIVLTNEELTASLTELETKNAPSECIEKFRNYSHIPYFQDADGIFQARLFEDWQSHMHPMITVKGEQNYYCALVKNHAKSLTCYQEYIDMPSNRMH
ncbi:MAG: hypothetical protein K6L76_00875 [Agarilytica sp.]